MRALLFILITCYLVPAVSSAQKVTHPPPPPPPPPSPKYDYHSNDDIKGDDYGMKVIRYPLIGELQLGMTKQEYDTLTRSGKVLLKTELQEISMIPQPVFVQDRLFSLELKSSNEVFKSDLADADQLLETKFGAPDKKTISDKNSLRKSDKSWKYIYYDISMQSAATGQKNGEWKGKLTIKFSGNSYYKDMLKSLDKLGD